MVHNTVHKISTVFCTVIIMYILYISDLFHIILSFWQLSGLWYKCMCVCVCVCVCVYVCLYVYMYVGMYVCMYVCVRLYVCRYICIYVCTMYVCMYVCMYVAVYLHWFLVSVGGPHYPGSLDTRVGPEALEEGQIGCSCRLPNDSLAVRPSVWLLHGIC